MKERFIKWVRQTFGIHMWNLTEAIQFVRALDPVLRKAGFGVGLTGSNLTKGKSTDDLDIIVYPLSTPDCDYAKLAKALRSFGMKLKYPRKDVQAHWRAKGSIDSKWVEVWTISDKRWFDRRVDVFFLR